MAKTTVDTDQGWRNRVDTEAKISECPDRYSNCSSQSTMVIRASSMMVVLRGRGRRQFKNFHWCRFLITACFTHCFRPWLPPVLASNIVTMFPCKFETAIAILGYKYYNTRSLFCQFSTPGKINLPFLHIYFVKHAPLSTTYHNPLFWTLVQLALYFPSSLAQCYLIKIVCMLLSMHVEAILPC